MQAATITVLEKKVDELNKGNQGKGYVSFKDACGKVLSIAIEARRRVGNNESVGISSGLRGCLKTKKYVKSRVNFT